MDTLTRLAADFLNQRLNEKSNWQYTRLVKDITVRVLSFSRLQGEDEEAFSARLRDALSLVDDLQHGLHVDTQAAEIWNHKDRDFLSSTIKEGRQSVHRKEVDRTAVRDVALRYLQRPWMENHLLEWMIVDSLLYAEIIAFAEEQAEEQAVKKEFGRGPDAFLAAIVLLVLVPIGAIFAGFHSGHADAATIGGIVYVALWVIYLFVATVLAVPRWIRSVIKGPDISSHEKGRALLHEMLMAYRCFLLGDYSIRDGLLMSREHLLQTANKGAVWDNAAWAILDNAIRRTPPAWIFDQSSAYNWGDEVENDSRRHWPISLRLRTPLITRGLRTGPPLEPYTGSWRLPLSSVVESPAPIDAGDNT